jgi:hypothetical protein
VGSGLGRLFWILAFVVSGPSHVFPLRFSTSVLWQFPDRFQSSDLKNCDFHFLFQN